MSGGWLRLYAETATDAKLSMVAARTGEERAVVLGAWLAILCHAQDRPHELRGTLTGWSDELGAVLMGISPDRVAAILGAMQGLLLDGEVLRGWSARQFRADTAADRMRAMRARKRAQADLDDAVQRAATSANDETACDVTARHGDVTARHGDGALRPPVTAQNQISISSSVSLTPARGEPVDKSPSEPPRRGPVTLAERRRQVEQAAAAGRIARLRPDLAHPPDSRTPFPGPQDAAGGGPRAGPLPDTGKGTKPAQRGSEEERRIAHEQQH